MADVQLAANDPPLSPPRPGLVRNPAGDWVMPGVDTAPPVPPVPSAPSAPAASDGAPGTPPRPGLVWNAERSAWVQAGVSLPPVEPDAATKPPAPPLPPVSEFGDLGNQWWNTQAQPPPGGQPAPPPAPNLPTQAVTASTPGYIHSDILPLARRADVARDPNASWYQGWALGPGPMRSIGQPTSEKLTFNPNTNTFGVTPEALAPFTTGVSGLKFGGPKPPLPGPPRITFDPTAPPPPAGAGAIPEIVVTPDRPAAPAPAPAQPTGYTTAKGSTYDITPAPPGSPPDAFHTTTRNKAYRPEHGPADQGPQPQSDTTFYVSPGDADKLGEVQTQGGPGKIIAPLGDGRWGMRYTDGPNAGKFEGRTVVTPNNTPTVGATPVELWNGGRSQHFGNTITEVRTPGLPPDPAMAGRQTGRTMDTAPPPPPPPPEVPPTPAEPKFAGAGELPPQSFVPTTAEDAKNVASAWYNLADRQGATLNTNFVNRFLADAQRVSRPRTRGGAAIPPKSNIVQETLDGLQSLRDEPLSLADVHEMDVRLGQLVNSEYGLRGLSGEGEQLLAIQRQLRSAVDDAIAGDVNGGTAGFSSLKNGRQAWAQARKLDDLEQMIATATTPEGVINPAILQNQVRTFLANQKRSRGWSPEERAALSDGATRGFMGGTAHLLGNRFIPMAAAMSEFGTGGLTTALTHFAGAHVAGSAVRRLEGVIQQHRINKARGALGGSIPNPPTSTEP